MVRIVTVSSRVSRVGGHGGAVRGAGRVIPTRVRSVPGRPGIRWRYRRRGPIVARSVSGRNSHRDQSCVDGAQGGSHGAIRWPLRPRGRDGAVPLNQPRWTIWSPSVNDRGGDHSLDVRGGAVELVARETRWSPVPGSSIQVSIGGHRPAEGLWPDHRAIRRGLGGWHLARPGSLAARIGGYSYTECSQGRRGRGGGVFGPDEGPPAGLTRGDADAAPFKPYADRPTAVDDQGGALPVRSSPLLAGWIRLGVLTLLVRRPYPRASALGRLVEFPEFAGPCVPRKLAELGWGVLGQPSAALPPYAKPTFHAK